MSTSLLFSVFESWYVSQHVEAMRLDASLLAGTFSRSTFANGLLAIGAGVAAGAVAEGPVARMGESRNRIVKFFPDRKFRYLKVNY